LAIGRREKLGQSGLRLILVNRHHLGGIGQQQVKGARTAGCDAQDPLSRRLQRRDLAGGIFVTG
jgi:hypothetical protein